jgi:hypothetical protein
MLASGTWGEGAGNQVDEGTWDAMTDGPAAGCGVTHFYTEAELPSVFSNFSRLSYERREKTLAERTRRLVHWLVTATR